MPENKQPQNPHQKTLTEIDMIQNDLTAINNELKTQRQALLETAALLENNAILCMLAREITIGLDQLKALLDVIGDREIVATDFLNYDFPQVRPHCIFCGSPLENHSSPGFHFPLLFADENEKFTPRDLSTLSFEVAQYWNQLGSRCEKCNYVFSKIVVEEFPQKDGCPRHLKLIKNKKG